ncbi:SRF [Acanthosepion pharaonis]|uniref:SRF n=1 Tax=Acanthosepion pharaonis TaxID=158019 RepID=A0A812BZF7_ACAPH|nr:SRF [Sepia pharaonis]
MQTSSQCETIAVSQYVHSDGINNGGGLLVDQGALKSPSSSTPTPPGGAGSRDAIISLAPTANRMKMPTTIAPTHSNNEMADENSDSESESEYMTDEMMLSGQVHPQQPGSGGHPQQAKRPPDGLKPGKKTKGRVKIKMEFIENKLRRYTTFSKRKTGIMKKAYELSTLTGTQVMLLVASETGHVYTFATRKLQPMITSESGKALIQTCLNSPDSSADGPAHQQRMNPTGFEETELTYSVEDESKADIKPILAQMPGDQVLNRSQAPSIANPTGTSSSSSVYVSSAALTQAQMASLAPSTVSSSTTVTTSSKPSVVVSNPSPNNANPNSATNISMQVPPSLTAILQPGTQFTIPIQQGNQQLTQTATTPQTMYRLPNSQVVSIPSMPTNSSNGSLSSPTTVSGDTVQVVTPSTATSSSSSTTTTNNNNNQNSVSFMSVPTTTGGSGAVTHGIVMYQTPQGVVYATPTTATLSDGSIFNFQQPAISVGNSTEQTAAGAQQIITIPVPLAGSQLLQFTTNSTTDPATISELTQPSLPKKARK